MNHLRFHRFFLRFLILFASFLTFVCLVSSRGAVAKGKSKDIQNPRIQNLTGEDLEMYNALTTKQKKDMQRGKIRTGYNAWMVELALGQPYYKSEHHPIYTDYEQVWLYTRQKENKHYTEKKIIDPQTNWPTIHKYTRIKTCTVGDFFVLFDRGVVEKIVDDKSEKAYGPCTISTKEEFIPIVDN